MDHGRTCPNSRGTMTDPDDDFPLNLQSTTVTTDQDDFVSDHDRQNQVSDLMDLFQQRVDHSHVINYDELPYDSLIDSDFGVIEENSNDYFHNLASDFGLGLGFKDFDGIDNVVCQDPSDDGFDTADDCFVESVVSDSDYYDSVSTVSVEADDFASSSATVRVITFPYDSDSNHDKIADIPLSSGSIAVYKVRVLDGEDDFGWDEDDAEIPYTVHYVEPVLSEQLNGWDEDDAEDHDTVHNVEDETDVPPARVVLTDSEGNIPLSRGSVGLIEVGEVDEEDESGWDEDDVEVHYTVRSAGDETDVSMAHNEALFEQLDENDGFPPASKHVVDNLPEVIISEDDWKKNNAICAVCKDDINVGEKAKQLPCKHHYHGDCIIPWLGIRNTCPVCRRGLPTD